MTIRQNRGAIALCIRYIQINCPKKIRPDQTSLTQVSIVECSPSQVSLSQVGPSEVSPSQVSPA
jgi:hypothetical protein